MSNEQNTVSDLTSTTVLFPMHSPMQAHNSMGADVTDKHPLTLVDVDPQERTSDVVPMRGNPLLIEDPSLMNSKGGHGDLPTVPWPDRHGRSTELIVPKWIYIIDREGRYMTHRGVPDLSTLTFRSGSPSDTAVWETIETPNNRFRLDGRYNTNVSGAYANSTETWYTANGSTEPRWWIHWDFIHARGDIVYLKDNFATSRFMSNRLAPRGYPIGRNYINDDSRMEIKIASVRTDITNIVYDINGAKVRAVAPLTVLETSIHNFSDVEVSQTLAYTYERWRVGTWNNTAGIELGVTSKFTAGVPFIASAEFEIKVGASYTHEWGGEEGVRQIVTSSTTVIVPARKRAVARIVVRNAQIDVGFTYTQRVLWWNGTSQETQLKGIYNNVDSWHVDVVVDNWVDV